MPEITFSQVGERPDIPAGYEYFPAGDHFLTRTVKTLCRHKDFTVYIQERKYKNYRIATGYYAPADVVAIAKAKRDDTAEMRAKNRKKQTNVREDALRAAKVFVRAVEQDYEQAEKMLDDNAAQEMYELIKTCGGNRKMARNYVETIRQAQIN